jgi:hypothetical protein
MRAWLCLFIPCRWRFHFNVPADSEARPMGVYQCDRCKTLSVGWAR